MNNKLTADGVVFTTCQYPHHDQQHCISVRAYDPVDRCIRTWHIDREEADPEHRFVAYRLAAQWFGNSAQSSINEVV